MFQTHEHSGFSEIEIYILQQQPQQSQIVDPSHFFEEIDDDEHTEVNVIDEEVEVYETLVDSTITLQTKRISHYL